MLLPNNYTIIAASGSQWSALFTIYDDDGTLTDITGKVFELVVRDRLSTVGRVIFSVNNTASTAYGTIITDVINSTVEVIVNAAATALVVEGGGPYTLWMDQNLADATALVTGTFFANPIAAP
jgi:hypothetical protein